jgi:amino acid transporter
MRKLSFEDAITWAVFIISLVLVAAPFFTGEETLGSLFRNRLALIGAVTLVILFIYKVPSLLKEKPEVRKPEAEKLLPPQVVVSPAMAAAPVENADKAANQPHELRKVG